MPLAFIRLFLVKKVTGVSPGALACAVLGLAFWIYLPNGVYLGGDWLTPSTAFQSQQFFYPYTWSSGPNFGMPWLLAAVGLPYGLFVRVVTELGLPVEFFGKTILAVIFSLAFLFFYRMLRHLGMAEAASIVAGLVYATSAAFFNYALMGWVFVLLAMALFPLTTQWLCQAMGQGGVRYAVGVAFIWALATLQSQSLVWFPVLFMAVGFYLVQDWSSAKTFLRKLGVVFIVFTGLSSYWWLSLVLFRDENVTSSDIVMSDVSVGADSRFTAPNALRLWGGLYNFQYESVLTNGWTTGAWLLPAAAILTIFLAKEGKRRLAVAMGLIAFILPIALLLLKGHRDILATIPGAGLIRQLSRFTVLATFAYAVLVGIFLDALSSLKRFPMRLLLYLAVASFVATMWPWWRGELTNFSEAIGTDFRLRAKEFPRDYYDVEKVLNEVRWTSRALYMPYGMSASYKDDQKFRGMGKEAVDIFAGSSPIPGYFSPSDRSSPIGDYMEFLQRTDNLVAATKFSPTNFYILRKNMDAGSSNSIFIDKVGYFPDAVFDQIWDSENITIYVRKTLSPLIYSPVRFLSDGDELDVLAEKPISAQQSAARVFASQNLEKMDFVSKSVSIGDAPVVVEYRRINPTKYRIRLHRVRGNVPLVYGESYSRGWRLYPIAWRSEHKPPVVPENYAIISGNERYQADIFTVKKFIARGWISQMAGEGHETRFVSKQHQGAIQNDYLPDGSVQETWLSEPIPEYWHIKVNGYANGWVIDVAKICSGQGTCYRNEDGSFDMEIVMEFWPQQIFYLGLAISGLTLLLSVVSLLRSSRKRPILSCEYQS
jgi:hypothetical protein